MAYRGRIRKQCLAGPSSPPTLRLRTASVSFGQLHPLGSSPFASSRKALSRIQIVTVRGEGEVDVKAYGLTSNLLTSFRYHCFVLSGL